MVKRLGYIDAKESVVNNNFNNENIVLVKFLNDRLEELIQKRNGVNIYLDACLRYQKK